jgi:DNA polymerase III delta prime subunit
MNIWNEKYRPHDLSSMILSNEHREKFERYLKSEFIPNLIFYGKPGVGKTTLALIILKTLDAEYLRLNGADEKNIEIVRETIKNFIQTKSFNKKRKIVFYDEAESILPNSFMALKELTERYHQSVSFIFCTNHLYKFPEAIRSRCTVFEFKSPTKEQTINFLRRVMDKEKVTYDISTLENVYRRCAGDLRRSLNYLQRYSVSGKLELPEDTFGEIFRLIKAGDLVEIKRYFAGNSVDWDALYRFLFERVDDPTKMILLGKAAYQNAFVVDPEINFVAFVAELKKLKQQKE